MGPRSHTPTTVISAQCICAVQRIPLMRNQNRLLLLTVPMITSNLPNGGSPMSGGARRRQEKTSGKINSTCNPMKITLSFLFAIAILGTGSLAATSKPNAAGAPADPGWPRQRTNEQGRLVYYQPQVDAWTNFKELSFRMAFSLTPKGGKEIVGVVELQAQTDVNMDDRSVLIRDFKIKEVKLPDSIPRRRARWTKRSEVSCRRTIPPLWPWTGWSRAWRKRKPRRPCRCRTILLKSSSATPQPSFWT